MPSGVSHGSADAAAGGIRASAKGRAVKSGIRDIEARPLKLRSLFYYRLRRTNCHTSFDAGRQGPVRDPQKRPLSRTMLGDCGFHLLVRREAAFAGRFVAAVNAGKLARRRMI